MDVHVGHMPSWQKARKVMKDRYLFRGKRIDNGEWVQGFLSVHTFIPSEEEFEKSGKETYLAPVIESVPERIYDHDVYEVDPSTICRCIGCRDKNGKLIWENDIIDGSAKRGAAFSRCLVVRNECKARYDVRTKDCNFPMMLDGICGEISVSGLDYEVIGNGFDNPELLEVQE